MTSIESRMFYGDNIEVFQTLIGFKIVDIQLTHTNEENEAVVVVKCVNEHSVAMDILFQEDGVFVTEPYAVGEDLTPIEAKREEVAPTRTKKVTHTANILGKTITECVTSGVSSAIQKSIRDTDEEDSLQLK